MQGPRLSIGLVVRNEASQILECLNQLKAFAGPEGCEIIIVDNNSSDQTLPLIKQWQSQHPALNVNIFERKMNHMAEARNQVLTFAKSDWIYFTDGDCRLQSEGWQTLLNLIGPDKAAFGGGNQTPLSSSFVSQGLQEMSRNWWGHMGSIQVKAPQVQTKVSLLSSCNLVLNRSVALRCGGFDNSFARVGEDLSLSLRLRAAGHELLAVPGIEVTHLQDRGLWAWCRKMFYYGEAQVHVAARYPQHFWSLRGLQFLAVLGCIGIGLLSPALLLGIFALYCLLLLSSVILSKQRSWIRLQGLIFIFISHSFYAAGEVSAILTLPFFILTNLPKRTPVLEKK